MSNRSYLIGLFIGLATFAIGCLLLLGNFFANANQQPEMPPSEMNAIESHYQYLSNSKDKKAIPKIINNYYENQFKNSNEGKSQANRFKINHLPPNQSNKNDSHAKKSSS